MKKVYKFLILIFILTCSASTIFALSGNEAISAFKSRMRSIGISRGIISVTYPDGMIYTGAFTYQNPGRFHIKFSSPSGKTIVSNGKKLWVYDPGNNICGIQDLNRGGSGGIASMINGYFGMATTQGSNIVLKLKKPGKTFSEIIIITDKTYLLKKAILKNDEGSGLSFTISNLKPGGNLKAGQFNFNVPANAQVVKNPLNIR